jgi:N-acetylmuramoyl-L-alanine amidase
MGRGGRRDWRLRRWTGETVSDWLEPEMRGYLDAMTEPQRVALVLYGEARSEPIEGLIAVGCVIRNRVKAQTWFGKTYSEVVTKPKQFSCLFALGGKANYKRVLALAKSLANKDQIADAKAKEAIWVAHGLIGEYVRDVTQGADHYHTAAMQPRPSWAQSKVPVKQIGGHVFYVLEKKAA